MFVAMFRSASTAVRIMLGIGITVVFLLFGPGIVRIMQGMERGEVIQMATDFGVRRILSAVLGWGAVKWALVHAGLLWLAKKVINPMAEDRVNFTALCLCVTTLSFTFTLLAFGVLDPDSISNLFPVSAGAMGLGALWLSVTLIVVFRGLLFYVIGFYVVVFFVIQGLLSFG